jgi:hypothetical protein
VPIGDIAAQLLDHLVGACQQCLWNRHAHRLGGLQIDYQLELGRLFDRNVGDVNATEHLGDLSSQLQTDLRDARSIGGKAAFLRLFRPLIHGWQAQ